MIVINTVSDSRFSLNGVEYLKNYVSVVHGNRVEIFNCYERSDVLLELTHYEEVRLNDIVCGNAPALHAALLPIIYSRSTLAGNSDFNQDNRGKFFYLGNITQTDTFPEVLQKINALNFTIYPVHCPVIFWGDRIVNNQMVERLNYLWLGGKGTFGSGGLPVTGLHLFGLPSSVLTPDDILSLDDTIINPLGEITDGDYLTALNSQEWELDILGKTYYFTYSTDDVLYFLMFIGASGTYNGTFTTADFVSTTNSSASNGLIVPTQQQVTAAGPNIDGLYHMFLMPGELLKVSGSGLDYKRGTKQKNIRFEPPIETDNEVVTYSVPAKKQDDTFAMASDKKKQDLKVIDDLIIDSLYTIQDEDFGKMLVYNGIDDINMLLSTNVTYEDGYSLHFIQASMGTIKVVTDGFMLHHGPDELPETYGFYSVAGITILEEFSAVVFGKLKLAD